MRPLPIAGAMLLGATLCVTPMLARAQGTASSTASTSAEAGRSPGAMPPGSRTQTASSDQSNRNADGKGNPANRTDAGNGAR